VIKLVAIGDVHGLWGTVWRILRAAAAVDADGNPTPPVLEGRMQIVFIGDLVHYKDAAGYAKAIGVDIYDPTDSEQLVRAAKTQIRDLRRFKTYMDAANGNVTVILGNHDESALDHKFTLRTREGLKHDEFNVDKGGLALPESIASWMSTFPRERIFYDVHFAHAGPLPGMQFFDDFFYNDPDTKTWWRDKPWLVSQARHRFGVYGHTPTDGVYLDKDNNFAMIDALAHGEYVEMIVSEERLDYRVLKLAS
jgi:hypothetical protein